MMTRKNPENGATQPLAELAHMAVVSLDQTESRCSWYRGPRVHGRRNICRQCSSGSGRDQGRVRNVCRCLFRIQLPDRTAECRHPRTLQRLWRWPVQELQRGVSLADMAQQRMAWVCSNHTVALDLAAAVVDCS